MNSWEKEIKAKNIQKGINVLINSGDLIEKAMSSGRYTDTPENRKKGIVGMPYRKQDNGSPSKPNGNKSKQLFEEKKQINELRQKIAEKRKYGKNKEADELSNQLREKIKKISEYRK